MHACTYVAPAPSVCASELHSTELHQSAHAFQLSQCSPTLLELTNHTRLRNAHTLCAPPTHICVQEQCSSRPEEAAAALEGAVLQERTGTDAALVRACRRLVSNHLESFPDRATPGELTYRQIIEAQGGTMEQARRA